MESTLKVKSVLFLCTGNSCRSQMAEGWARHIHPEVIEAQSAGTAPKEVDRLAVRAMKEAGVDISSQASKSLASFGERRFDLVVTVCDAAAEACPHYPYAIRTIHRGFDDPPKLAEAETNDNDRLEHYRRVRDEIRDFVRSLPELL